MEQSTTKPSRDKAAEALMQLAAWARQRGEPTAATELETYAEAILRLEEGEA